MDFIVDFQTLFTLYIRKRTWIDKKNLVCIEAMAFFFFSHFSGTSQFHFCVLNWSPLRSACSASSNEQHTRTTQRKTKCSFIRDSWSDRFHCRVYKWMCSMSTTLLAWGSTMRVMAQHLSIYQPLACCCVVGVASLLLVGILMSSHARRRAGWNHTCCRRVLEADGIYLGIE